jgi:pimeloyl-ACP methyl ester carboxylesterase
MQLSEGYIAMEDGLHLYYQRLGSSPKTVVIPNGICFLHDFGQLADGRTLIFYDVRNRGRSETVTDPGKLACGIQQDVDDLDAVRRHFGIDKLDVIGHSYVGLMVGLYAIKYAEYTGCVVQIGPAQPDAAKQYSPPLSYADAIMADAMAKMAQMRNEPPPGDPEEMCRKFWSAFRVIFVTNPADAGRIDWGRCDLANERNFLRYWMEYLMPSIQRLQLTPEEMAKARAPMLIVHGTKDRNAPYGAARDWARGLPNARLLTVENAAHAPWIEAPELVFGSIRAFLDGEWPEAAEKVV